MSAPGPVCLRFGEEITKIVRARISYAFRVFAAIYNYRVVEPRADSEAICLEYAEKPSQQCAATCFHVPARYALKAREKAGQLVRHRYANEDLYLSHGVDAETGNPDWLGELFEWLSSSHELDIRVRDPVGRIPYRETIFNKQGISPRKPYATLLMAWMENALRNGNRVEAFAKAPSPIPRAEHLVVCTHDIDFYHASRASTLVRLAKNLGLSLHTARSLSFFLSSSNMLVEMIKGKRVGNYLPAMLEEIEKREFQSTLFVVPRRGHRRDPNYELKQLVPCLSEAADRGFTTELHGSYTSVIEGNTLKMESLAIEKAMGKKPLGNRQHWLRFDHHDKLFGAIEEAALVFDSTMGFSDMAGFRNGASFAFPPYDFKNEKPYPFLEIPLALMDVSLEAEWRTLRKDPQLLADEVLRESRRWGWGGISVLWHNPMEALHVSEKINEVFWNCAPKQGEAAEKWMSADQFVTQCLSRYQNAGLMQGVHAGA
jgi:hypothetical protein